MRKMALTICILSFLLLAGHASSLEIEVVPANSEVRAGEITSYDLVIENNMLTPDEFVISVSGKRLEWLTLDGYYVRIGAQDSKTVSMDFYPNKEGVYEYGVLVYSDTRKRFRDETTFTLTVLPGRPVRVESFRAQRDGGNLLINLDLFSENEEKVEVYFEIMDSKGNRVKYVEISDEIEGHAYIEETLPIGDLTAGEYEVRMGIEDFDITGKTTFYVPPVTEISKKKKTVSSIWGDEVTITVENKGNVEEDYVISEKLPQNEYVDFEDMPTSSEHEEGGINYRWSLEGFAAGEREEIKYSVSRVPLLIGTLVIVFAVFALLGMGNVKVSRPSIKKKHVRRKGEHLVVLEIKGPLTKKLGRVMVKDMVSPLGNVREDFEGPRPVMRKSSAGTELIWRLGDVKPRSEIYLSYKIKPLIEAQQLKMPRAFLSYRTDDNEKRRVYSKQVVLE